MFAASKKGKRNDKAQDETDMYDSIENKVDEETRHYLKRVIAANPQAKIVRPNGYYDTDEDEAKDAEKYKLKKTKTSRFAVRDEKGSSFKIREPNIGANKRLSSKSVNKRRALGGD